jgi:hypothetical protein
VTVGGAKQIEATFDLQREATVPPTASLPGKEPAAPGPSIGDPAEKSESAQKDGDGNRFRRVARPAAWSAAVGAAVLLGFGVFETITAVRATNKFEQHVGALADNPQKMGINCGADDPGHGGQGCDPLYKDLQRATTLSIVGYGAGGLLAVGSALLFWTSAPPAGSADTGTGVACAPTWPAGGASCRFTF